MPTYAAHCQPPFQFIIADIQQFSLQCDFNENSINYVLSCTRLPLISQSRDPIYALERSFQAPFEQSRRFVFADIRKYFQQACSYLQW